MRTTGTWQWPRVALGPRHTERVGLNMNDAFTWLRDHARTHNLLLADVAQAVIDGTVAPNPPSP
jgi:spermidine synthase